MTKLGELIDEKMGCAELAQSQSKHCDHNKQDEF
jgi:hypothetical protein